jgi:hypothetical protein
MGLGDAIEAAKQREQIQKWNEGERRIAAELELTIPATTLTNDIHQSFGVFARWCELKSCRKVPSKPQTVAAFILDHAALAADSQVLLSMVQAIDALHQFHGLNSPIHTAAVYAALERVIRTEPPHSWSKAEKGEWALLPLPIRAALARRENDRDNELRRLQSKIAKDLQADKERRQTNGAEQPIQSNEDKELRP